MPLNRGSLDFCAADVAEATPADHPAVALWRELAEGDHRRVSTRGDVNLLARQDHMAFFCSVRSPGDVILKTYDTVRGLRDARIPVIGGFHSPMEKECLGLLLRGPQPVAICPARGIEGMRVPKEWRKALNEGRLLILSPFPAKTRRVTAALASQRNYFVATLADVALIAHAAEGSKTEQLARDVVAHGKTLLTLDSHNNENLIALGAVPVTPWEMPAAVQRTFASNAPVP